MPEIERRPPRVFYNYLQLDISITPRSMNNMQIKIGSSADDRGQPAPCYFNQPLQRFVRRCRNCANPLRLLQINL